MEHSYCLTTDLKTRSMWKHQWRAIRHAVAHKPYRHVIFAVHGFGYSPFQKGYCPFEHILSHGTGAQTWPARLLRQHTDTMVVGIGWNSRGTLHAAYDRAADIGEKLALFTQKLHASQPNLRIGVIGHSLGARVILNALPHIPTGHISRAVLLNPAEFEDVALDHLRAARACEVLNISTTENLFFRHMFKLALGSFRRTFAPRDYDLPHMAGLNISDAATLDHLARSGYRIEAPQHISSHCSSYMRAGTVEFYSDFLTHHSTLSVPALKPRRALS